jgi:hypothetical protein
MASVPAYHVWSTTMDHFLPPVVLFVQTVISTLSEVMGLYFLSVHLFHQIPLIPSSLFAYVKKLPQFFVLPIKIVFQKRQLPMSMPCNERDEHPCSYSLGVVPTLSTTPHLSIVLEPSKCGMRLPSARLPAGRGK